MKRIMTEAMPSASVAPARALLSAVSAIAHALGERVFEAARVCVFALRSPRTQAAALGTYRALARADSDSVWAALVRLDDIPLDCRPVGWQYAASGDSETGFWRSPASAAERYVLDHIVPAAGNDTAVPETVE